VIYEEAALAATREGWDLARWMRHLAAKLHGHGEFHAKKPIGLRSGSCGRGRGGRDRQAGWFRDHDHAAREFLLDDAFLVLVRPFSEIGVPKVDVKPEELKLAMQLMEQNIQEDFHPERYKDTVRERMLEIIQQKVEGQEITFAEAEEPKAQIIDLMDALKASLGVESGEGRKPSKASKPAEDRKPARRSPRGHAKVEAPKKRASR